MFSANWPAPKQVKTLQTTRRNGVSQPPFSSLNLGAHVGDDRRAVETNRKKLAVPQPVCWLNQVHGDRAIALPAEAGFEPPPDADAVFTFEPGQACAVMTADCLPVLLTDKQASFVAAVHCGWRGLANGILSRTLAQIQQRKTIQPEDILVWLGPAIGPQQFEVGEEVQQTFTELHPDYTRCFKAKAQGKQLADIYQLAQVELNLFGINAIYSDFECTVSQADKYFSYRRDKQTGRQASLIWLEL